MEAFAVVATVASIVQLSQAALTLSKALHAFSSDIASAKEDANNLADDLRTFSHSLNLLSRLLEDSKAWYSDDVYLLTAKIIRDCADLYTKIDKVLVKAGGNGTSGWKSRVKFVYKESQIKKLLERLRDMKSTLATILMSLQVDLQLSLLSISSASQLQRSSEKPLQHETVQTLQKARELAENGDILPRYTDKLSRSQTQLGFQKKRYEKPDEVLTSNINNYRETEARTNNHCKNRSFEGVSLDMSTKEATNEVRMEISTVQSLRSSSSTETFVSFASAISTQSETDLISSRMDSVESVVHVFKVALETLQSMLEKRFPGDQFSSARDLKISLASGSTQIEQRNTLYYTRYGYKYIQAFTRSDTEALSRIGSSILADIVTPLHIYSAPHKNISEYSFDTLLIHSRKRTQQTFEILTGASNLAALELISQNASDSYTSWPRKESVVPQYDCGTDQKPHNAVPDSKCEWQSYGFGSIGGRRTLFSTATHSISHLYIRTKEEDASNQEAMNILSVARVRFASMLRAGTVPPEVQKQKLFEDMYNCPQLTLPFIGYTFKRFEQVTDSYHRSGRILSRADIGNLKDARTKHINTCQTPPNVACIDEEREKQILHNVHPDCSNIEGKQEDSLQHVFNPRQLASCERVPISQEESKDIRKARNVASASYEPDIEVFIQDLTHKLQISLWERSALIFQSSYPDDFKSTSFILSLSFGPDPLISRCHSSDQWCNELLARFETFDQENRFTTKQLKEIEMIIQIVTAIHKQLGLSLGSRAWCCVYAILDTISTSPLSGSDSQATNAIVRVALLEDLLDVTGIVARYNVMENLYNGAGTGLVIHSEYQVQLVDLCVMMLRYFNLALLLCHSGSMQLREDSEDPEESYTKLLVQIRELDKKTRGFRVLISLDYSENFQDDESDEAGDEDWEEIDGEGCTTSKIDLNTLFQ